MLTLNRFHTLFCCFRWWLRIYWLYILALYTGYVYFFLTRKPQTFVSFFHFINYIAVILKTGVQGKFERKLFWNFLIIQDKVSVLEYIFLILSVAFFLMGCWHGSGNNKFIFLGKNNNFPQSFDKINFDSRGFFDI